MITETKQIIVSDHAAARVSERTSLSVFELADIIAKSPSVVRGNTHYVATRCGVVPVIIEGDVVVTVLDPIETRLSISLSRLRQYFGSAMYREGFTVYGEADVVQGDPYDNGFVKGYVYKITAAMAVVTWSGGNIAAIVDDSAIAEGYYSFKRHQADRGRFI